MYTWIKWQWEDGVPMIGVMVSKNVMQNIALCEEAALIYSFGEDNIKREG